MGQSGLELGLRIGSSVRGAVVSPTECSCESVPRHLSLGASVSFPISRRIRLRFDPGYQRIGFTDTASSLVAQSGAGSPLGVFTVRYGTAANRWLLPVGVERDLSRHIRFAIGPELSIVTGSHTTFQDRSSFAPGLDTGAADYLYPVTAELFGMGASLEFPFRFGRFVVAPGLTYHRCM